MRLISKYPSARPASGAGDGPATQASRLCCLTDGTLFAADGADLLRLKLPLNEAKEEETALTATVCSTSKTAIQSITCHNEHSVTVADGVGNVLRSDDDGESFKLQDIPSRKRDPEFGWCGIAYNLVDSEIALTSMWGRETFTLNSGVRFEHELPPTSVSGSPTKAGTYVITEWTDVTIWDVRAPRGGLVERLTSNQVGGGGNGPLWACDSQDNYFAVGGEDRTVSLFDDRRMRIVETWKTPLKHDIVGMKLVSLANSKHCVVAGLDHELSSWTPPLNHSKRKQRKSPMDVPESEVTAQSETEVPQVAPLEEDEERRTNLGRLHHNHRVFRSKSRWTGICVLANSSRVIGRDMDGTVYSFELPAS